MTSVNTTKQSVKMDMEIPGISKLNAIWSPEFSIHGIPWKVQVYKGHANLFVCFHCFNKDESPNWSLSAMASFKLISFGDNTKTIEINSGPHIFEKKIITSSARNLIKWNDLIGENSKYVKDDTINLEIEVTAENPNSPNRSRFNFDCIQKCCDDSSCATFRVTVSNIANLIAVQSPNSILNGRSWNIQISKTRFPHLGVLLESNVKGNNTAVKMTMSIILLSAKNEVRPIEISNTKQYHWYSQGVVQPLIQWYELMKPENGFVKDNTITLEIVFHSEKPNGAGDMPTAKRAKLDPATDANYLRLECPICLKSINKQHLSATPCGHMFCFDCIDEAVTKRAVRPMCNKVARKNTLRRIYLPFANQNQR